MHTATAPAATDSLDAILAQRKADLARFAGWTGSDIATAEQCAAWTTLVRRANALGITARELVALTQDI